jgi:predicted SprT family Zn-dependent metalloprotease
MELSLDQRAPATPRIRQARTLAQRLLSNHGLRDWSFRFNRSKCNMGLCRFDDRSIELSLHFVERNPAPVGRDTLQHEIAQALVGPGHGHDTAWKQMCLRVGARPERVSFEVDMPDGLWQARCPGCGLIHHKHRKPKHMKGWSCKWCGPMNGRLLWVRQ